MGLIAWQFNTSQGIKHRYLVQQHLEKCLEEIWQISFYLVKRDEPKKKKSYGYYTASSYATTL